MAAGSQRFALDTLWSARMEIQEIKMRLRALAKINLGLDVVRKREDGYHEVRMIMQTIIPLPGRGGNCPARR